MLVLAPVLLAMAAATVHASDVSAQTEERAIYASVLDKSGAPVAAVRAADLIVREGGVTREVLGIALAAEPLRIAVLVDTSQAMTRHVNDVRGALRGFFRDLQGDNEIALFEFGDRPTLITDYTTDAAQLNAGIGRLFARRGSGAYVLDAIVDASKSLRVREGREQKRRVIVVISADGPEFSNRHYRSVVEEVERTNATLHSFLLEPSRRVRLSDAQREREMALDAGARATGGRREHLLTSMSLNDQLRGLAQELKGQYRVVYSRPTTLIAPDSLRVSVKEPGWTVRASRAPAAPVSARRPTGTR
jgi:Ca-activated chloride channel family protein